MPNVIGSAGYNTTGESAVVAVTYDNVTPFVIGIVVWSNTANYRPMLSATFNSIAMSVAVRYSTSRGQFEMWYLIPAPVGSYTMQWNCQSPDTRKGYNVHAMSVNRAYHADPWRNTKWANCSDCYSLNDTISSIVAGDLVLSLTCQFGDGRYDVTPNGGQTIIEQEKTNSVGSYEAMASVSTYTVATGTSENEGGYWSPSSYAGIILAAIKPGKGGSRGYVVMSKMREFFEDIKGGLIPPDELRNRYRGLKEQGLLTI